MSMILFNPTNEDFETQYIGETVFIKSESKVKVDDPRGRHILNNLGPRGLMTLEYGDEGDGEERKREEGIERNRAFKRKQVLDFNLINSQRKQGNLPYLEPSSQVRKYAQELGIGIEEFYNVENQDNRAYAELNEEKERLRRENEKKDKALEALNKQVNDLTQKFSDFMAMAAGGAEQAKSDNGGKKEPTPAEKVRAEKAAKEAEDIRKAFKKLNKKKFIRWIGNNWKEIQDYPDELRAEIADRHQSLYGAPMPEEAPVIGEYDA